MDRRQFRSLVLFNIVLLGVLGLVTLGSAQARQERTRSRGQYAMVSAKVQGISENVLFFVDSSNQEMLVVRWDRSRKAIKGIGFRDLASDSRRAAAQSPGR